MRVRDVKSITRSKILWSGLFGSTKPGALKTTSKYDVKATPPARVCALWQPEELHVKLNTGSKCRSKLTFDGGITISAGSVIVRPHEYTPKRETAPAARSNNDIMRDVMLCIQV
jgi:hypothetical protein